MIHNGERPWRCPFCDLSFTLKGTLMRHIRRQHKTVTPEQSLHAVNSSHTGVLSHGGQSLHAVDSADSQKAETIQAVAEISHHDSQHTVTIATVQEISQLDIPYEIELVL